MRILVATFTYHPNKDGVAEASAAAVKAFLSQGWRVDVATAPAKPGRMVSDAGGARIYEFAIEGGPHFRDPYRGEIERYRDFVSSGRWDVILFQGYSWPLDLAVPLFDFISAKKILVSHGYGALMWFPVAKFPFGLVALAYSAWKSLLMLRWIKKVDHWVFLSKRRDFRSFYDHRLVRGVRHPHVTVIPNGLDPERLGSGAKFRKSLGLTADILVFLCVGYFSRGKNQLMALRAYREACIPNSCLVFVAPKPNEWMTFFKHADPGPDPDIQNTHVFWLTDQSKEQTLDAFAGCDLYTSSSYLETQPISILEAMRESKPWIALKAGCLEEMPGGLVVTTKKDMVKKMRYLSTHPEKREVLGRAGRHSIENEYNLKNTTSALVDLVRHTARKGKSERCR